MAQTLANAVASFTGPAVPYASAPRLVLGAKTPLPTAHLDPTASEQFTTGSEICEENWLQAPGFGICRHTLPRPSPVGVASNHRLVDGLKGGNVTYGGLQFQAAPCSIQLDHIRAVLPGKMAL